MARRYFDWAATSLPDAPLLSSALTQSLTLYGNPSSRHAEGRAARDALEHARARCAAVLGVPPETLYFTSSGTEADNIPLLSLLRSPNPSGTLIVSAIEHPAVREPVVELGRRGFSARWLRPGSDGIVSSEALAAEVSAAVAAGRPPKLVAVMAVNNETGAVMDVPSLVRAARDAAGDRARQLRFHCDAVQAVGKIPVNLAAWGVDSAAFSAHKIGGPRGIGLLYSRRPLEPTFRGGGQEKGLRPGTENLFGAIAFAAALETRGTELAVAETREAALRREAAILDGIAATGRAVVIPECRKAGDPRYTPYIVQVAFPGIPAEVLVRTLDDEGVAVSTGSACASATAERPVLEAMGVKRELAFSAIRISQGQSTTDEDVEALLAALRRCLSRL
jgi:cysteine desulfurase